MKVEFSWNVMTHGDTRVGKWRGNWRIEWVASTLHTTSEHGVSSITTSDAHTSAASRWLNWRPRWFKRTPPFRQKTKSGFCTRAITFQTPSTTLFWDVSKFLLKHVASHPRRDSSLQSLLWDRHISQCERKQSPFISHKVRLRYLKNVFKNETNYNIGIQCSQNSCQCNTRSLTALTRLPLCSTTTMITQPLVTASLQKSAHMQRNTLTPTRSSQRSRVAVLSTLPSITSLTLA
jgi:hypothetical protein